MNLRAVAGIDIGTTSICGVLYDPMTDEILHVETSNANYSLPKGMECESIQSPQEILDVVKSILGVLGEIRPIERIGISCQMHGMLYIDSDGNPVSPFYTWQDGRGDMLLECGEMYSEVLSRLTGIPFYTGYGLTTHFWFTRQNRIPSGAARICTIGDFVGMALGGSHNPLISPSNAASFGGFILEENRFDTEALQKAGIDVSFLPTVVPNVTVVSNRSPSVCVAIGDNQASFIGAIRHPSTEICLNIGTSSQVSVWSSQLIDCGLDTRPFPSGGFLYVIASLNGGCCLKALAQFICDVCKKTLQTVPDDPYEVVDRLLNENPPELEVSTDLYGMRGQQRTGGAISGITPENFNLSSLVHGFVEGMAKDALQMLALFPSDLLSGKHHIVLSGNAIRKNPKLAIALSQNSPLPAKVCQTREEAAFGAAKSSLLIDI